jgi:hypothetical protein
MAAKVDKIFWGISLDGWLNITDVSESDVSSDPDDGDRDGH